MRDSQNTEKHYFFQLKLTDVSMVLMAFLSYGTPTAARLGTERPRASQNQPYQ